jgi:hypothetical protein
MNEQPKKSSGAEIPKVIVGPETKRILQALSSMPRRKSTPEEAKRQTEIHLESAKRNLLAAGRSPNGFFSTAPVKK